MESQILTKRELIAAMALQGLLAYPGDGDTSLADIAARAVRAADDLIAALQPRTRLASE